MFKRRKTKSRPVAFVISEAQASEADGTQEGPSLKLRACGRGKRHITRARNRIIMVGVVLAFLFGALGVRLGYVSFGEYQGRMHFAAAGGDDALRPELFDRNGMLLATDLPMIALEIAGREVWDPEETIRALTSVLPNIDADGLSSKIAEGRYVEVRADITPAERREIFNLGLPGVRFSARSKRFFPNGALGAHVIGHDEPGKGGVMGLEKFANSWRENGPLHAALDIRVQQIFEEEIEATMRKFSATAAWGAMMDVHTGEVVALVSLPDFDPNKPGAFKPDARRNRATYDRYELGSAFKALTAAAALNEEVVSEGSIFDARGPYRIADRVINDYHGQNRLLNFSEVVQHSSNIGMAQIALELGAKEQRRYLEALGMFDPLAIELSENRPTQLPTQWGPVETATISYGHGISVTPLHLLSAFGAVVNGGTYHVPTFLRRQAGLDRDDKGVSVYSAETSTTMRRVLRRVITDGTASAADAPGLFPIGKTATADKPNGVSYDRNTRIASFVGAIPGYAPQYAILVSFDEPQPLAETHGYATAGWNAAPTFSRIASRVAPLLHVEPVNEAQALHAFVTGEVPARREALIVESTERVQ